LTCRELSRLPIVVGMKENRIDFVLGELRRRASLPEPSRRRALRRRVGLSQSVIADAIGVSPPTVSRIEAGISAPRGDVLARYLQILALLAAEGDDVPDVLDAAARRRRAEAARACRHDKE
jgi:DNA-binding transcriptional regulator YiaG